MRPDTLVEAAEAAIATGHHVVRPRTLFRIVIVGQVISATREI
jgi:hypothetical protein